MKIRMKWGLSATGATLLGLVATIIPPSGTATAASAAPTRASIASESSCTFGNPDVHHVIQITFDNVHFNRDNPNVLSDIEQLPALESFIESNGTLLSNSHTPLIAHTANDTISDYTGLYGDRDGIGISNDYGLYSGGTASEQSSFNYWTAPSPSGDAYPAQPYSATSPASGGTTSPPAPWAAFADNGCDTAGISTSNMELENVSPDISTVFGATSPEQMQVNNDADSFKDQETNDYLGLAVHCAAVSAVLCTRHRRQVRADQSLAHGCTGPDWVPGRVRSQVSAAGHRLDHLGTARGDDDLFRALHTERLSGDRWCGQSGRSVRQRDRR